MPGQLNQVYEIYCDLRTHEVLSSYILMSGFLSVLHCVWSFQIDMFNFTDADISRFWSILGIYFAFSVFLFCHPFGGRDSLKKRKIHEDYVCVFGGCWLQVCFLHSIFYILYVEYRIWNTECRIQSSNEPQLGAGTQYVWTTTEGWYTVCVK